MLTSCYKDLSTEATTSIPEIEIGTESSVINVSYGHEITLKPTVTRKGRTEEDFEYLWEMDLQSGSKSNRLVVGEELTLNYKVGNSPSERPYYLTLKVTDKETGLSKYKNWSVYVSSSLGEGIIVGYTNDGGKTSDIDLIASKNVTYGFGSDTPLITRNLYSFANGAPLKGTIKALVNQVVTDGAVFNTSRIGIGTEDHIIMLGAIDYKETKRDAPLFNSSAVSAFGTSMLFNFGAYDSAALVGEDLYTITCNFDNAYTKVPATFPITKEAIAYAKPDQGKILIFNPEGAKLNYVLPYSATGITALSNPGLTFSLVGAKALGGGSFKEGELGMVLRTAGGQLYLVTVDLSLVNPVAESYPIEGAKDIDKAVSFAFCDNCSVFYYATPEKIYYNILKSGYQVVSGEVTNWAPDSSDEKITLITHYTQNWWGTCQNFVPYEYTLSTHRAQVVITTYNEKTGEGKVYLKPFNVSTGKFTVKDNGKFGGFGRITAIATTSR